MRSFSRPTVAPGIGLFAAPGGWVFPVLGWMVWMVGVPSAQAQTQVGSGSISLSTGVTYSQNFDSPNGLASTGGSNPLGNNQLPAGWFFQETGTGASVLYYVSGAGSPAAITAGPNSYSFGTALGDPDRAFGGLSGNGSSSNFFATIGSQFVNNTGSAVTSIQVQFYTEQWSLGSNAAGRPSDALAFQYSTNATQLIGGTGTWTNFAALNATSVVLTGTVGDMNGNNNRQLVTATITGVNIANGGSFWFRWQDQQNSVNDALGIDDFSITVPEPATILISGTAFVLAAGAGWRRWHRWARKLPRVSLGTGLR